jgi:hypothetical protein
VVLALVSRLQFHCRPGLVEGPADVIFDFDDFCVIRTVTKRRDSERRTGAAIPFPLVTLVPVHLIFADDARFAPLPSTDRDQRASLRESLPSGQRLAVLRG